MSKSLRERAELTAKKIQEIAGVGTDQQSREIADAIERSVIGALLEERERCAKVAFECCEEDQDRAHKVAGEIRRIRTALIANLSSLR